MGLYNSIDATGETLICPLCNKEMIEERDDGDWQSKNMAVKGRWVDVYMDTYKLADITEGEMHGMCENCKEFVELEIADGKIVGGHRR